MMNAIRNHSEDAKVSVVMTSYNGERFIREQIDSILPNLDEQDELLIGDDGSSDSTLDILRQYEENDARIHIFQSQHLGTTGNLEALLKRCSGDIIFLCDQDDRWEQTKVRDVCADFEAHPEIDLVFHNAKVSTSDINDITYPSLFEYLSPSNHFFKNVLRFHFWGCMFAVRRSALRYLLPFRFGFDSWMMFCATFFHRCYLDESILMTYRRHGGNLSTFKRRSMLTVLKAHLGRLAVFFVYLPVTYARFVGRKKDAR